MKNKRPISKQLLTSLDKRTSTMKKSTIIMVMITGFCLITLSGWAATYVSDKLEAPLRTGPGPRHKIVGMLQSGQAVDVISEKEGWSNVRSVDGSGDEEGWTLSRYLMNREPWEKHVKVLEMENASLKERVSPMEGNLREMKTRNADLAMALKEKMKELETLKESYESLRKDASGFIELRKSFEKTRLDLARIEAELANTSKENELLRSFHRNRWFLTGALVLLLGLLIGLIMGRLDKKRSSKLYL